MHIIPVIDLLGGCAVHAVRGQRDQYRPIASRLCAGSDPVTVARAMLAYCASRTLYVADLDAITGKGLQQEALQSLCRALPGVTLWLDAGFADAAAAACAISALATQQHGGARVIPVFGSESLSDPPAPAHVGAAVPPFDAWPDAPLSLDRRHGMPLGSAAWWQASAAWPAQLIVMALDRVGAFEGPDLETLAAIRTQAGAARKLIGAGGVRHAADLAAAARAGASAWLVASAIHDLLIEPAEPTEPAEPAAPGGRSS
ncbi:HisA/HisF-related TIM barrel protein [Cupriavidus sp. IK-TO18]|uniref:HisA/HisF-related TIM barrel protein n=1 Tax=Cupriavidus sp. IK-TO18 TaxID=2782182 RepID=UPI001898262B|nr:HisA/HisF-related TIM barrel protein [Cupriavidus sp. IK-TO18]MBF6989202.1 nickel transporter [Cupriavidus sp. IK-TO18]